MTARRARLLLGVVLGSLFMAFTVVGAPSHRLTPVSDSPSETVQLSTDAGSGPMFSVPVMSPDHTETNCLELRYSGVAGTASARLYATAGGALAPYLHLTAEAGTGGRYGDCSGFTGTTVYQGTLADFLSAHGTFASGLPVFDLPDASGTRAMRFTFDLDSASAAQGLAGTATFYWAAVDAPLTPTPTGAVPVAPTETGPAAQPSPSGSSAPVYASPSAPSSAATASGTPAPSRTRGAPTAGGTRRGTAQEIFNELIRMLSSTAGFASRNLTFPSALLAIIVAFLAIQNRIDARDPKLALAPVSPPPDLEFVDPEEAVS
jgi:hypothetical protein